MLFLHFVLRASSRLIRSLSVCISRVASQNARRLREIMIMCDLDLYIFLLFYYLTYIYLIILKNEGSRRAVRPDRTSARCASVSPRLLTRYLTTNRVHGTRVFLGRHASLSSRIVLVVAVSSSSPDQDDEVRMTMIAIAENRCRAAT